MTLTVRAQMLTPEQMTALRMATRHRLQETVGRVMAQATIIRDLVAGDLLTVWDPHDSSTRFIVGDLQPARMWRAPCRRLPVNTAVAIWGYASYAAQPQIDVVSLGFDGITLAELSLAEVNAEQLPVFTDEQGERVMRYGARVAYFDPAVIIGPGREPFIGLLSQHGVAREEFNLLGQVCEPVAVRVVPDQALI